MTDNQSKITEEVARKVLDTVDAGLVKGVGKPVPGSMCVEAAVCYAMGLPHGDEPTCVSAALRRFKIGLNDTLWSSDAARAKGMRRLALAQLGSAGALEDREFAARIAKAAIQKAVPVALRAAAKTQKDDKHRAELLRHADICELEGTRASAAASAAPASAAASAAAASAYASAAYAASRASAAAVAASAAASYASAASDASAAASYAASYASAAAHAAVASDASAAASYASAAAHAAVAASAAAVRDSFLAEFAETAVQILIEMKAPGCQWLYLTEGEK